MSARKKGARPQPAGLARAAERKRSELDRIEQEKARPLWDEIPSAGDVEPEPAPELDPLERIAAALERIATQLEHHTRIVAVGCPAAARVPT